MSKAWIVASAVVALGLACGSAQSAELAVRPERMARIYEPARPACGCRCGCLEVTHVRHREIAMTYGSQFDPRRLDEPRYYWGPERSYPRYRTWYDAN